MSLRIGLFITAVVLLAAHFFRLGQFFVVAMCLTMPLLFLHKRRLSLLLLQGTAYAATASWLLTSYQLVQVRQMTGQGWTVAAVILGIVALFTLLSGLLLNARCMRERYPL